MSGGWLAALGCLACALAAVHSAAVPTQETLVVARSDETTPIPTTVQSEELTTSEPPPPIKLTEMDVKSEVSLRYAHTAVVTKVRNPASQAQEATFRVLLPETAFISGFVMILNGKPYKAYVKEKEEAKQIYNQAVSQGISAAHVATKARDSNHFTVSVNVEPNTEAVFNLTYEELLTRRNGVYNHAINLHPGVLVPKLHVLVHVKEAQRLTQLRVPEIRTGNEVDAQEDDPQNSKALIEKSQDGKEATITFSPDLEEQKRLMEVYVEKSKEAHSLSSQPWWYRGDQEDQDKAEGVLGQFVVQYDVDRPKDGEILVNDGYFVHFFSPPSLPPLNKHVVFVLDTSGSMMDRKIVQLREAMQSILSDLNAGDYFSIVEFSSFVQVHDLAEALQEPPPRRYYYEERKPLTLVPPSLASPENIDKAKVIVSRLNADGGTNIDRALEVAIELINKGIAWTPLPPGNVTSAPEASPATSVEYAAKETNKDIKEEVKPDKKEAEGKKEESKFTLEPMIIFLTDGEPTVGETDPKRIISQLSEKNIGRNKASIFSLAFGEDADRGFLRKLSLRNEGFMRHIYEASDAALQLRDFYRQVSSPLLAHVKFTYPANQVKEGSVTKHKFRTMYLGSEAIVAGKVNEDILELAPEIEAFCGVDDGVGKKKYTIFPKVPVARKSGEYLPLERLWAYLNIKQLLDERDTEDVKEGEKNDKADTPEKKALALALKYEFVTPLTSLVVVKPNATNAVDAESVDKESGPPGFAPLSASYASPMVPASFVVGGGGYPGSSAFMSQAAYPAAASISSFSGAPVPVADDLDFALEAEMETDLATYLKSSIQSSIIRQPQAYGHSGLSSYSYQLRLGGGAGGGTMAHRMSGSYPAGPGFHGPDLNGPTSLPGRYAPPPRSDLSLDSAFDRMEVTVSTTPAPRLPSPLATYHLESYPWTEPFIDVADDALKFEANGTSVSLKLSRDVVALDPSYKVATCARAVSSAPPAPGYCVYLTRCVAAQTITMQDYETTHCPLNNGLAGVCCPESSIVKDATPTPP